MGIVFVFSTGLYTLQCTSFLISEW